MSLAAADPVEQKGGLVRRATLLSYSFVKCACVLTCVRVCMGCMNVLCVVLTGRGGHF
jgi:hypothetical protein